MILWNYIQFPELRQQLARWCFQYFWGPCPDFRLENHVTEWPDVRNVRDVQLAQDTLCRKGFLIGAPFWDVTLFPNFKDEEGGSAFALRVHHCLTDGIGHVALLNAIGGLDPSPPPVIYLMSNLKVNQCIDRSFLT